MTDAAIRGQFAEELAELHDGSISLFVTLPVFRSLVVSGHLADALVSFEGMVAEHLAHLDGILGDVLIRRDRSDGYLTKSLFQSITHLRVWPATSVRDDEILHLVQQAQMFLMGSCSFALRCAKLAHVGRAVHVLEESLARIGSLAAQLIALPGNEEMESEKVLSNAVA